LTNFLTNYSEASHRRSPRPTVEDVEDVDAHPQGNIPPKNPRHILESAVEEVAPPAASHKKAEGPSTTTKPKAKGHQPEPPTDEDMEDEDSDAHPQHNIHRKNPQHVTELSDDDDNPEPHPKKSKSRKKSKKKATVVDPSSDDQLEVRKNGKPNKTVLPVMSENAMDVDSSSDDQAEEKRKANKKAARLDSDIEEIENPKESPEEELGERYLISRCIITYRGMLKNGWKRTGYHRYMDFSSHVLQSRLLMGVVATSLSVQHHIARAKARRHES
jgi:hypothetical protein